MKGIMVLGFNENFEAYIKSQYPDNISESFKIKPSDLMNIYTLHRMDKNEPNFFQMEIKDFTVASFFTGFNSKLFVGKPDFAITAIFSNDQIENGELTAEFEGFLRKIAHEILPKSNEADFNTLLEKYFIMLKNGDLEPYWEEYNEDETTKIIPIPNKPTIEISNQEIEPLKKIELNPHNHPQKESEDAKYFKLENEVLKGEIETLDMLVKEKSEKIRELTKRITETVSETSNLEDLDEKCKHLEEENATLKETIEKMTDFSSQNNVDMQEQTDLINELKKNLETKDLVIEELNQNLEKIQSEIKEAKKIKGDSIDKSIEIDNFKKINLKLEKEIDQLKRENNVYIDSIADLKLQLRNLNKKVSSEENAQTDLTETLIELKKEIKVLRRERDHYKEIIKEHNLL
ncbi:MAG: hypothetical protein ACFFAO_19290 [Candidatus Hermodarchaeota archaeon]